MVDRPYAYHTPEALTGTTIVRQIVVPFDLLTHVGGALGELIDVNNWDEIGVSIEETVKAMFGMIDTFYTPFMVGAIQAFATHNLPLGWLLMDGQEISQGDYPELFMRIPDEWKDGVTATIPDMSGAFLKGDFDGDIGEQGGEKQHALTVAEMPSHNHNYERPQLNLDLEGPGAPDILGLGIPYLSVGTSQKGGSDPHNNLPPYLSVIWAIFAGRHL